MLRRSIIFLLPVLCTRSICSTSSCLNPNLAIMIWRHSVSICSGLVHLPRVIWKEEAMTFSAALLWFGFLWQIDGSVRYAPFATDNSTCLPSLQKIILFLSCKGLKAQGFVGARFISQEQATRPFSWHLSESVFPDKV